jgi:nitrite reductase/ring-hydroxylating ferredoxin subunit
MTQGTEPLARELIAEKIEEVDALDAVAEPLQHAVRTVVPQDSALKDVLSGTWLGHPVHPPLTDVVIGAWTSALILDLVGGPATEQAAERLIGAGILASLPTAAAGASDWADVRGGDRRVGTVHALGNTTALLLHTLSWAARRRGHRTRGVALSAIGYAVATFSAWLGGHLSFGKGIGVNQTAFESAPSDWTPVLDAGSVPERELTRAEANGVGVLLVRDGEWIHALSDRCSHRGCSLSEGELLSDAVRCRCHGSTFRLEDGSIVKGPATAPQPAYDARESDGTIQVRARS